MGRDSHYMEKEKNQVVVVSLWAAFFTDGGKIFSALMSKSCGLLQSHFVLDQSMVTS